MATWFSGTRGAEVYTWTRTAPEAKGRTAHGNRRDLGLGCLVLYVQRAELSTLIIVINTWVRLNVRPMTKWQSGAAIAILCVGGATPYISRYGPMVKTPRCGTTAPWK